MWNEMKRKRHYTGFQIINMVAQWANFYIMVKKFDKNVKLEAMLNTSDDSDISAFVEIDSNYPVKIKEITKSFPFCPENKISPQDKCND